MQITPSTQSTNLHTNGAALKHTSGVALTAMTIAIGAVLGSVYRLFEAGPSSYVSKLVLLAMALLAFSMGTDELRQHGDADGKPVAAMFAQRVGVAQAALGGALLIAALI